MRVYCGAVTSPTFVLRSRRVVTPDGVRPAAVHVADGTIVRVAEWTDAGSAPLEVNQTTAKPMMLAKQKPITALSSAWYMMTP